MNALSDNKNTERNNDITPRWIATHAGQWEGSLMDPLRGY